MYKNQDIDARCSLFLGLSVAGAREDACLWCGIYGLYACPVVCVQNCIGETTQCFLVAALYN